MFDYADRLEKNKFEISRYDLSKFWGNGKYILRKQKCASELIREKMV